MAASVGLQKLPACRRVGLLIWICRYHAVPKKHTRQLIVWVFFFSFIFFLLGNNKSFFKSVHTLPVISVSLAFALVSYAEILFENLCMGILILCLFLLKSMYFI